MNVEVLLVGCAEALGSLWTAPPNTALEPTASPPLIEASARFGACRSSRRGSALDR